MKSNSTEKGFAAFASKHKLLLILIAMVVIAALAVTIILISLGSTPPPDELTRPDPNPITNGADQKEFYYDLPGGTTILTLMDNWNFTMVGPELHKSGEYGMKDDKILLDFVRNSDGAASATLNGTKLTLVWNEATLTFRENVKYTVSFNTDSDDKIDSVEVTNGKTVAAPEFTPEKDGYSFDGWYADEALTKPFGFGVSLITGDTVIYAKWVAITP